MTSSPSSSLPRFAWVTRNTRILPPWRRPSRIHSPQAQIQVPLGCSHYGIVPRSFSTVSRGRVPSHELNPLLHSISLAATRDLPPSLIAARFEDTWSKLRVFELHKYGCEKLIFLDADMLVRRNMDELFEVSLPRDWIASTHACVCNLDKGSWAPPSWTRGNCSYTGLCPGSKPTPVPVAQEGKETHTLLNSGLFIFTPFEEQWARDLRSLGGDAKVRGYMFPDQDFLADFFGGRWKSLAWEYNALKTWQYWHRNIWRDEEVRNLHYIVDKPWSQRVGDDGVAVYLGRDGTTHGWWCEEYGRWEQEREKDGKIEILKTTRKVVAGAQV